MKGAARAKVRRGPRARYVARHSGNQRGLVLLTFLIALMLMSIALAAALDVWWFERRREQETQLLFVGDQYRLAILRYYRVGRTLPASIDDLLDDRRFPTPLHHLRRAWADPITGRNDWELMMTGGRIYGVHSRSEQETIKRSGFPLRYEDFEKQKTYSGWLFFFMPTVVRSYDNTGSATGGSAATRPASPTSSFDPLNSTLPQFTPRPMH
nr:type II secretion system protein [Paraburkholderia dinghuensis]